MFSLLKLLVFSAVYPKLTISSAYVFIAPLPVHDPWRLVLNAGSSGLDAACRLLATIKKELKAGRELHEIQEILGASVFPKMPILSAFSRQIGKLPTPSP
jgi:hypothetical protein